MSVITEDILMLPDDMRASLQFQEAFRPATSFTNVSAFCGPYEIMTDTEAKVLLEMALLLLNSLPTPPQKGTMYVYGQHYQKEASPIIKLELNDGRRLMGYITDSGCVARNTIGLSTGLEYRNTCWGKFLGRYSLDRVYPHNTEIYSTEPGTPQFLNVAALHGHFVICLYTDAGRDQDELVLWGLAQTIALLREGDATMTRSLEEMRPLLLDHHEQKIIHTMDTVQRMFANLDFAVLRSWKNCRNIAEVVDVNHLFFE